MGLRRVQEVGTVFALKLIWRLSAHSYSLWGSWVRQYLLRGETLWDVKDTGLGSWVWRKILKFRTLAKHFLRIIKNGQKVKFWTDVWLPAGRLIDLAGEIGTEKLGISRNARSCDVLDGGGWGLESKGMSRPAHTAAGAGNSPVPINADCKCPWWSLVEEWSWWLWW